MPRLGVLHPTSGDCRFVAVSGTWGAFRRWHITSDDLSEESFSGLERAAHGPHEHAVAFHGFSSRDGLDVIVGGLLDDAVRGRVRQRLETELQPRFSRATGGDPAGHIDTRSLSRSGARQRRESTRQIWRSADRASVVIAIRDGCPRRRRWMPDRRTVARSPPSQLLSPAAEAPALAAQRVAVRRPHVSG